MIRRQLRRAAYALRDKAAREIQQNGRVTDVDLAVLLFAHWLDCIASIGEKESQHA